MKDLFNVKFVVIALKTSAQLIDINSGTLKLNTGNAISKDATRISQLSIHCSCIKKESMKIIKPYNATFLVVACNLTPRDVLTIISYCTLIRSSSSASSALNFSFGREICKNMSCYILVRKNISALNVIKLTHF